VGAGKWDRVAVLLKIYAYCIHGQADAANNRITDALGVQDTGPAPEPSDEGDGDIEPAS
jgi:hypothetical protein